MHRHTHKCRHIDTLNRSNAVCNQAYQRRGCSLDRFSQLGNSAQTQFNFISSLDKKSGVQTSLTIEPNNKQSCIFQFREILFDWMWRHYKFAVENNCRGLPKRTVLNPGWRVSFFFFVFCDAWCLLAGLRSVTHLHVCLPGRWVCWRCPCAGKNTPLWPPRSHWLSANQETIGVTTATSGAAHRAPTHTHTDEKPIDEASS